MEDKKYIVEQNGKETEVSKDKIDEMKSSPDYQVEQKETSESEEKYKVKERLYD